MGVILRVRGKTGKGETLEKDQFSIEVNDLQEILFNNPDLLKRDSDLLLKSVCKPLFLDYGGLDLFLINREGMPVAVEVKYERNQESNRIIIGQLLDYMSSLSKLNYDKINSVTKGKLEEVALSFLGDTTSKEFKIQFLKEFKQKFNSNLNSRRIRGILALDSAPIELLKSFNYLNDHSVDDYRLVTIQRNRLTINLNGENREEYDIIYSAYPIFNEDLDPSQIRPYFKLVKNEFCDMNYPGIISELIYSKGKIKNIRNRCSDWNDPSFYYEISDWEDRVTIEIQAFKADRKDVIELIKNLKIPLKNKLRCNDSEWKWTDNFGGFGRLMFYYDSEKDPHIIAEDLCILIEESRNIISKAINAIDSIDTGSHE